MEITKTKVLEPKRIIILPIDQTKDCVRVIDWAIENILSTDDLIHLVYLDESLRHDIVKATELNLSEDEQLKYYHQEFFSLSLRLLSIMSKYLKEKGYDVMTSSYVEPIVSLDEFLKLNFDRKNLLIFSRQLMGTVSEKTLAHKLLNGVIYV